MPIDCIASKEMLDLLRHLTGRHLPRPALQQLAEHRVRPAVLLLPQFPINAQLSIGHAHVNLVQLLIAAVRVKRRQLSRWRRVINSLQTLDLKLVITVENKTPQILFTDRANRVDISR